MHNHAHTHTHTHTHTHKSTHDTDSINHINQSIISINQSMTHTHTHTHTHRDTHTHMAVVRGAWWNPPYREECVCDVKRDVLVGALVVEGLRGRVGDQQRRRIP